MKIYKTLALGLALAALVSCGQKARISGTLTDAPEKTLAVATINGSQWEILDSIKVDKKCEFSYKIEVEEGQPEFLYFLYNGTKVASLLLVDNSSVKVTADTLGHYEVEGSPESERLRQVEYDFAAFMAKMRGLLDTGASQGEITRAYVDYYRSRVKYVVNNYSSLTIVPVLFQKINSFSPIFSQTTDSFHFRAAVDSLKAIYPDSKYVAALEKETVRRENSFQLEQMIRTAPERGYFDISAPDVNGRKIALSDVADGKLTMLYFWNPEDNSQAVYNMHSLLPIYKDFHSKGFEIYAFALTPDKALWAETLRDQNLPWVNVCDGLGADSPVVSTYNIGQTPIAALIYDGEILVTEITGDAGLRRELQRILK